MLVKNHKEHTYLVGFIYQDNPALITKNGITKPRIHLAYKMPDELLQVGYKVTPFNKTLRIEPVLTLIDSPIEMCEIDFDFMEPHDIKYYKIIGSII